MQTTTHKQVLIVANRTAATPKLLELIRGRADRGSCAFTLLVPQLPSAGEDEARKTMELALPLLEEAAGAGVEGVIGPSDALLAVESVLVRKHYDEVIVSTLPERVSHWLKRDLPARIERLGLPVTVVTAKPTATRRHIAVTK